MIWRSMQRSVNLFSSIALSRCAETLNVARLEAVKPGPVGKRVCPQCPGIAEPFAKVASRCTSEEISSAVAVTPCPLVEFQRTCWEHGRPECKAKEALQAQAKRSI